MIDGWLLFTLGIIAAGVYGLFVEARKDAEWRRKGDEADRAEYRKRRQQ